MKKLMISVVLATCAVAGNLFGEYVVPEWNKKARREYANKGFGIFIHWGFYANYAGGEWYLKVNQVNEELYTNAMYGFYPSKFDAKDWVRTFKEAGAKYITITSRHHDGFSMWPTKVDDGYNISKTPFNRDILGELAKACKEEGLQLNFYYSLMDWHRKDYPAGRFASLIDIPGRKGDYKSYKKFMMAQLAELADWYKPGYIWFDGEWDHAEFKNGDWQRTMDWELDDLYDLLHEKKVLVANNNHQPIRAREDIQAFERDLPGEGSIFSANQPVVFDRPLEQCEAITKDVWGYWISRTDTRPANEVVSMIALAASRGANSLMNVGPNGAGMLSKKDRETLKGVGEWFKKNGESIYNTDRCALANGKNVVTTRRDKTIYVHFINPDTTEAVFPLSDEIVSAKYLDGGKSVAYYKTPTGKTVIEINRDKGNKFDIVVKVELK